MHIDICYSDKIGVHCLYEKAIIQPSVTVLQLTTIQRCLGVTSNFSQVVQDGCGYTSIQLMNKDKPTATQFFS